VIPCLQVGKKQILCICHLAKTKTELVQKKPNTQITDAACVFLTIAKKIYRKDSQLCND
jgi:hypothetical protein